MGPHGRTAHARDAYERGRVEMRARSGRSSRFVYALGASNGTQCRSGASATCMFAGASRLHLRHTRTQAGTPCQNGGAAVQETGAPGTRSFEFANAAPRKPCDRFANPQVAVGRTAPCGARASKAFAKSKKHAPHRAAECKPTPTPPPSPARTPLLCAGRAALCARAAPHRPPPPRRTPAGSPDPCAIHPKPRSPRRSPRARCRAQP